jgi:Protein of unknown function (DUF2934)
MASRRSPDAPRPAKPVAAARSARPIPDPRKPPAVAVRVTVTAEARRVMIAEHAYLRAERRGFAPGQEAEDWLAAETEVDALLKLSHGGSPQ